MSLSDFAILEPIGKGAFASVFKVRRKSDNQIYALKRVKINKMSLKEISDALNEIRFLAAIKHRNVVGFFEAFLESNDTEICIIMEFCGYGDLSAKVERYKRRRQFIEEKVIWGYMIQLLDALLTLHQQGIIHRDIKAANCFIGDDGSVKLGDLNISKRIKSSNGHLQTQIGTPYYMSPEIWQNRPYDASSDIWALGCLLYELCCQRPPFLGDSFSALKRSILAGRYTPISPIHYSEDLSNVISRMISVNASDRPSASSLMSGCPAITSFISRHRDVISDNNSEEGGKLMGTIKVPSRLRQLTNQLPPARYPNSLSHDLNAPPHDLNVVEEEKSCRSKVSARKSSCIEGMSPLPFLKLKNRQQQVAALPSSIGVIKVAGSENQVQVEAQSRLQAEARSKREVVLHRGHVRHSNCNRLW